MDRTSAPGSVAGMYVDDDPPNEIQGTLLIAKDRISLQEELMSIIEAAGITPNADNYAQVLAALNSAVDGVVNAARLDSVLPGAGGKLLLALGELSSENPVMDGTAAPGSSNIPSRQDHVHPSDTSRFSPSYFENVAVSSGGLKTETPSTPTTYNALNVTGKNVLYVNAASGNMTINGFTGGVTGQTLEIIKTATGGSVTLNNANASGTQKINTPTGQALVLPASRRGGVTLRFDGTTWLVVLPGSIDADPGSGVLRDSFGRIKVADPAADDDADTMGARDAAIAAAAGFVLRRNQSSGSEDAIFDAFSSLETGEGYLASGYISQGSITLIVSGADKTETYILFRGWDTTANAVSTIICNDGDATATRCSLAVWSKV